MVAMEIEQKKSQRFLKKCFFHEFVTLTRVARAESESVGRLSGVIKVGTHLFLVKKDGSIYRGGEDGGVHQGWQGWGHLSGIAKVGKPIRGSEDRVVY